MAKTWTLSEAYEALQNNDKAAILDFGGRFPLATHALEQTQNAGFLLESMPEYMTMRKLESALKDGVKALPDTDGDAMTPEEAKEAAKAAKEATAPKKKEAPKKEKKAEKPVKKEKEEPEEETTDYSSMSAPELYKLCKQKGLKAEPKKKSDYYIKLLEEAEKEPEEDDSWDDEEEEAPAPKKKTSKKAEEEEDDWDI